MEQNKVKNNWTNDDLTCQRVYLQTASSGLSLRPVHQSVFRHGLVFWSKDRYYPQDHSFSSSLPKTDHLMLATCLQPKYYEGRGWKYVINKTYLHVRLHTKYSNFFYKIKTIKQRRWLDYSCVFNWPQESEASSTNQINQSVKENLQINHEYI